MFFAGSVARAKTFDIGSGTVELPDDFVEISSAAHEPFGHGFSSKQRGLFIGWIINGHSDAPAEKRIERHVSEETGTSDGLSYLLSIRKVWDTRITIVFSDGPQRTGFWSDVKSEKDLQFVKSLMLTFKAKKTR
jgi:hypothetical protein